MIPAGTAVAASAISFGVGVAVGAAFDNIGYDWHGGGLCWGNWGGYRGDVNINRSAEFNRNVNVGDINVNNRPRPGNEGQRWTPDRDRLPTTACLEPTSSTNSGARAGARR